MQSLLAIEWLKIKRFRTFWILTGLFAVLFPLWNLGVSNGLLKMGPIDLLGGTYSFSDVWSNVTAHASNFIIFIAILVSILVTNEYGYKTHRQNMIDGWSRLQVYHAKWLVLLVLAVAVTLFVFLTGIVLGISKGAAWDGFGGNIIRLAWMLLLSVNYLGFAMLIAHLVKRSGLAISLFVIYSLMFESLLHLYFFYGKQLFFIDLFLPLQCSDQLLQLSSLEGMQKMGGLKGISPYAYAVASLCWIAAYYIIGRIRLLRTDW